MSIYTIAEMLNLSPSTVSRALNNYPDISAKTRLRVREAALQIGHQLTSSSRQNQGKANSIAFVTSFWANNYIDCTAALLHAGAYDYLQSKGYSLISMSLNSNSSEILELKKMINGRLVAGFLIARTYSTDRRVRLLQEFKQPFVTHGRTITPEEYSWVDADNSEGMFLLVKHLVSLGHRRIAFFNGPAELNFSKLREDGFRAALAETIYSANCPTFYGDVTPERGAALARVLIKENSCVENKRKQITAIMCATDAIAIGAMQAAKMLGVQIGVELSVAGYGNSEAGELFEPGLTTIDHAPYENGKEMAEFLLKIINGERVGGLSKIQGVNLIVRKSTGEPRV
jgi:LacI family transcriptional regulator